jgi:peptidoglycan/LPS O-acetylase OafA/YrhL
LRSKKQYSTTPLSRPGFIPALEGLRGLAALLVVSYHYFDVLFIFRFGWAGVDMLLVLSGYLLARRIDMGQNEKGLVRQYLWRRLLRIVPLYLLLLLLYFFMLPSLATPSVAADIVQNRSFQSWYYAFIPNWLFVCDGYPAVSHLAYLWTIGVQVQFYLMLLPLLLLVRSAGPRMLLLVVLMLIGLVLRLNIRLETTDGSFTNYMYNTAARLDTLFAGCLVYFAGRHYRPGRKKTGWAMSIILAVLLLIVVVQRSVNYTGLGMAVPGLFLIACFSALLIHWLANSEGSLLHRFFLHPVLQWAGRISFSLYLVHVPVFAFFSGIIYRKLEALAGHNIYTELGTAFICFIISCVLAFFGYRLAERKLYSLAHPVNPS